MIYWTSASLGSILIKADASDGFFTIFYTLVKKDSSDMKFLILGSDNNFSNILSIYSS